MCAVWWKPRVFTQVGFTLTFPPHILYSSSVHNVGTQGRWVPLGNSLAIIKQHKTSFPGPFRIPSNILYSHFLSPHPSLYISNLKPKHLAIKVSQDGILLWLKQWPKGLPGRRRLQQQISTMCAIPYVFAYVTLIKSTHSLTLICFWKQDSIKHTKFFWNFRNSATNICGHNVSSDAVEVYMKYRYPQYDTCDKPCTEMDIQTSLVSRSESAKPRLTFMFGKTVPVSREVLSHSSFNLVAELGGYLGLTLGLSLMHLELPIKMIWNQIFLCKTNGRKSVS